MRVTRLLPMLILLLASPALASKLFVEAATGPGISESELATATELVKAAASEAGNEVVTDKGEAKKILRPKLIKLGASYVLSIDRLEDGHVEHSAQLKAARFEEMDRVAVRVTRSALESSNAKEDTRVGEVTEQESKEGTERKPARVGNYFGFGPASISNANVTGLAYSFGAAHVWDVNHAMLKLQADFTIKDNAFFLDGGIGGNYFITDRDVAPFIGALAGFGVSKTSATGVLNGETVAGFALGASAGVQFLRTSAIHLEIAATFSAIMNSNALGMPSIWGARVGLYF